MVVRVLLEGGRPVFPAGHVVTIDVQGYELEVFKGAQKTLRTINAIITEVSREPLYENSALVQANHERGPDGAVALVRSLAAALR